MKISEKLEPIQTASANEEPKLTNPYNFTVNNEDEPSSGEDLVKCTSQEDLIRRLDNYPVPPELKTCKIDLVATMARDAD